MEGLFSEGSLSVSSRRLATSLHLVLVLLELLVLGLGEQHGGVYAVLAEGLPLLEDLEELEHLSLVALQRGLLEHV